MYVSLTPRLITFTLAEIVLTQDDTPEDFRGGPVGLQIIGRKLTEENTLALAKKIVSCLV